MPMATASFETMLLRAALAQEPLIFRKASFASIGGIIGQHTFFQDMMPYYDAYFARR